MDAIRHGGDLSEARAVAAGREPWLDLSTGINPHAYPVSGASTVAETDWTRLPQRSAEQALARAARAAYRVPDATGLVAGNGTQAIIQWLPEIIRARRVAIVGPTYAEHAAVWSRTRAQVDTVSSLEDAGDADVAVVVNPNNPDGTRHDPATLADFAASRGTPAALVVDEAFGDLEPERTVAGVPGALVLRSFGKFYGLAGVRLGFAIGAPAVVELLATRLGPWAVSGSALAIGTHALSDTAWAASMRIRLAAERAILDAALGRAGLAVVGGTDLFRLVEHARAQAFHHALAAEGVWTRAFPEAPHRLRIGLPGERMADLETALDAVRRRI